MEMTGAQILMETLLEQGTDVIFGYPGGTVLDLYEQIYRNEGRIRHVLPSHEQGGIYAADGYARATGKTSLYLLRRRCDYGGCRGRNYGAFPQTGCADLS